MNATPTIPPATTPPLTPPGLKFGALINPNSRRNRRRPPDLSALRRMGIPVEIPATVGEMHAALVRLAAAEVDVLGISGGDGAVLAALTAILCEKAFERPPILCLLPGGTTNMTAADVGLRGRNASFATAAKLALAGGGRIVTRPVLRLDGVIDAAGVEGPRAGMFFGAVGICRAITFCRRHLHSRGVVGGAASWLTLAPLLLRNLLSADPEGVLAGAPATIRLMRNGVSTETLEGPWSVLLASTLERLALGCRPFWGAGSRTDPGTRTGSAPPPGVDATFVRAPVERLARNILPLLFGRSRRPPEPGYVSRQAEAIEIAYAGEVTLDGELYQARPDRPFCLSIAGEVRFLVG